MGQLSYSRVQTCLFFITGKFGLEETHTFISEAALPLIFSLLGSLQKILLGNFQLLALPVRIYTDTG